jgi:hypothetical protein
MSKFLHTEDIIGSTREKLVNWLDKVIKWININWDSLKITTHREKKETIVAIVILKELIIGHTVSDKRIRFLKLQSLDLIKILFLISLKFIPLPIPFTPLAIFLGKKVGINVLPSSHI